MALKPEPALFEGYVMHRRQGPVENGFVYPIYYLFLPIDQISSCQDGWKFGVNRRGLLSFYAIDHGDRKDLDLRHWINNILAAHHIEGIATITLMALPRVLGYVFNPVSFWFCHDETHQLRAVLCEVNNTFGEAHSYLCFNPDHSPLLEDAWLTADKVFHVSPFLQRCGSYRFRFALNEQKIGIWINYSDTERNINLFTALTGHLRPFNRSNLRRVFWRYPVVTLMAIGRIHWQALKLWIKGVRYVPKPAQQPNRLTSTKITKI